MGGLGSDAAIEAADIVIMTDEPSKIATAVNIAKRTRRIVWQNIIFALGVKGLVLLLGAFGIATMWEAVFRCWCDTTGSVKCNACTTSERFIKERTQPASSLLGYSVEIDSIK